METEVLLHHSDRPHGLLCSIRHVTCWNPDFIKHAACLMRNEIWIPFSSTTSLGEEAKTFVTWFSLLKVLDLLSLVMDFPQWETEEI